MNGVATYPMPAELRGILQPVEDLTVSEWCDKYRKLSSKFSAKPGRWSTAETPYLKEPMDAFTDPTVEAIGFLKCSRVGGTELANNLLAYAAVCRPLPTMYVQPEKEDVEEELHGRIRSVFEGLASEQGLPRLIPDSPHWVHGTRMHLNTMDIYGAWGTNPGTMKRRTIGFILFDEIDNSETTSGRLGNTLDFLVERVATYGYRAKVYIDGTPTFEDASGWQFLLSSDYRKPYVPCPKCGHYQVLSFKRIKLKPGFEEVRDPERVREEQLAGYECEGCGVILEHREVHRWMIDRVVWVPSRPDPKRGGEPWQKPIEKLPLGQSDITERAKACGPAGHRQWKPQLSGTAPVTRRRGYWINVLYSPWQSRSWSHILARFFECKSDREKLRVFNNSWLAEPWRDAIEKTDIAALRLKTVNSYPSKSVPHWAKILLMGADVQAHELYFVIRAWGPWERSALIYEDRCTTFDQLYNLAFFTGYELMPAPGAKPIDPAAGEATTLLRCHSLAIDSGHRTDEVYEFARLPGVIAVKGMAQGTFRTKPSKVEYHPAGLTTHLEQQIQLVQTNFFKSKIARLMALPMEHRSSWALPRDVSADYLEEVTAEHQVRKRVGGAKSKRWDMVWEPRSEGAPNHRGDAEVYGAALADMLKVPLMREHSPAVGVMEVGGEEKKPEAEKKPDGTTRIVQVPRGWLR